MAVVAWEVSRTSFNYDQRQPLVRSCGTRMPCRRLQLGSLFATLPAADCAPDPAQANVPQVVAHALPRPRLQQRPSA